jgi:hypothetical protein
MIGLPVKLAGASGLPYTNFLAVESGLPDLLQVPSLGSESFCLLFSLRYLPKNSTNRTERRWIESVTQMQSGYETRKSENGKRSDSDNLLEPGVTVVKRYWTE